MTATRGFASDNAAPVHPEVLAAIVAANTGHAFGYGHDDYTRGVEQRFAEVFGAQAQTFFVFNGSGANVLCLRAACRPWQAAIVADTAHLNLDEGGAPEAIAGIKLLTVPHRAGKLTPKLIEPLIARIDDEHAVQPRVVSITQSTELGTVYSVAEVQAIAALVHRHGMVLHMDGARVSNAAAALGEPLRALTSDAGVDLLSFGGTKNGALIGEAIVVLEPALADGMLYLRKQTLQLASKMRFLAAQFDALLTDELWLRCAGHANAMAARLADAVAAIPGVELPRAVEANGVFAVLPRAVSAALQEQFDFHIWDEATGEVRWMCAWDTTESDVDAFAAAIEQAMTRAGASRVHLARDGGQPTGGNAPSSSGR